MLTTKRKIHRPLECMWQLTEMGLMCCWVQRQEAPATESRGREVNSEADRMVAWLPSIKCA